MEKDFKSWLHQGQLGEQFPNAKSLKLQSDLGMQNASIPSAMYNADAAPTNGALHAFGVTGVSNVKPGHSKEPHGWFYCLPRFRQGFVPDVTRQDKLMPKTDLSGKVPAAVDNSLREGNTLTTKGNALTTGTGRALKQFLVFDQTGNKTTMIFSSEIGSPVQRPTAWSRKPTGFYNVDEDELRIGSEGHYYSGPNLTDESDDDHAADEADEMHEDTEEINALLYSDDENDFSDDGEETSTGHSPSTMTASEKEAWYEEQDDMDEVASSAGPVKRQKLSDSGYQIPSLTYTAVSRPNRSLELEDDAESSCAGSEPMRCSNMSGNKRLRKEKIRETVSILQTILPGGKSKDAVVVLDEAIDYLRSLKFKAKSLGLSRGSG